MKIINTLLLIGLLAFLAPADGAQPIIPFSAKLTDTAGRVIDQSQTLTFRLYTQAVGGSPVWSEVQTNVPIAKGILSVNLGVNQDLGTVEGDQFWVGIAVATDAEMVPRLKLPGYAASSIGGGSGVPVGTVLPFAGSTPPSGYALCDGSPIGGGVYPRLFAAIGQTWGSGDGGILSFNLPDLRGRAVFGVGQGSGLTPRNLGTAGGAETHTLSNAQVPPHNHSITNFEVNEAANANGSYGDIPSRFAVQNGGLRSGARYYSILQTDNSGGGQPHPIMPPFTVLNYIIKVK